MSLWFEQFNFKYAIQRLSQLDFMLLIMIVEFCFINNSSFALIALFTTALRSQFTFFSLTNARFFFIIFLFFIFLYLNIFSLFLKLKFYSCFFYQISVQVYDTIIGANSPSLTKRTANKLSDDTHDINQIIVQCYEML